jgi:short subunit dehydrogenase-like uncharacterized protein
MNDIWVLGATGRSGSAIAAELVARHHTPVLVGRDARRLDVVAENVGRRARTVVAGSVADVIAAMARTPPGVVVNTIGPFASTALPLVGACPPGTHYVDLTNDLPTMAALLARHDEALAEDRCVVAGAGFGVAATESVVLTLCADRPVPDEVRVDAVPTVAIEAGRIGSALAATIVDGLPAGGRRYRHGRLVRAGLGSDVVRLVLPDGSTVRTGALPSGELEAARRASGAPSLVAASSEAPTGRAVRAVLPTAAALLSLRALRTIATRRLAGTRLTPRPQDREFSWARARISWSDGTVREGWLRTGEASAFTAAVAAEVADRLVRGAGRPGAHTPGALFGPELAVAAGGRLLVDERPVGPR